MATGVGQSRHPSRRGARRPRIRSQLIRALVSRLDRRMSFALTVADAELFVAFADGTLSGNMTRSKYDVSFENDVAPADAA